MWIMTSPSVLCTLFRLNIYTREIIIQSQDYFLIMTGKLRPLSLGSKLFLFMYETLPICDSLPGCYSLSALKPFQVRKPCWIPAAGRALSMEEPFYLKKTLTQMFPCLLIYVLRLWMSNRTNINIFLKGYIFVYFNVNM